MRYTNADKVAEQCSEHDSLTCKARDKYRDCDRPLCCGFCPSIDDCESVCTVLQEGCPDENS